MIEEKGNDFSSAENFCPSPPVAQISVHLLTTAVTRRPGQSLCQKDPEVVRWARVDPSCSLRCGAYIVAVPKGERNNWTDN